MSSDATTKCCRICGGSISGVYCVHCQKYDIPANRYPRINLLLRFLAFTGLAGVLSLYVERHSSRAENARLARQVTYDRYMEERASMQDLQESIAMIFSLRSDFGLCPHHDREECLEFFAERDIQLGELIAKVTWSARTAFPPGERADINKAATNSWNLFVMWREQQFMWQSEASRCLGSNEDAVAGDRETCNRAKAKLNYLAQVQNTCLSYISCELMRRENLLDRGILAYLSEIDPDIQEDQQGPIWQLLYGLASSDSGSEAPFFDEHCSENGAALHHQCVELDSYGDSSDYSRFTAFVERKEQRNKLPSTEQRSELGPKACEPFCID